MDKKEAVKARINKLKHKNKKYKNVKKEETEKIEHTVEKKSVEKVEDTLPSNWSRYEINEHSDEEISGSANFETLLDKPLSQGSHFIFKNEENWSNNIEFHAQFQKYFMVDINLLNVGVATVPFTKRHGYDCPVLKTLDEDIDKNLQKYQNYLNKRYPSKPKKLEKPKEVVVNRCQEKEESLNENSKIETVQHVDLNNHPTKSTENIPDEKLEEEIDINSIPSMEPKEPRERKRTVQNIIQSNKPQQNDDEELDSLLNHMKIEDEPVTDSIIDKDPLMETTPTTNKNVVSSSSADLEQWLDDILDD